MRYETDDELRSRATAKLLKKRFNNMGALRGMSQALHDAVGDALDAIAADLGVRRRAYDADGGF